MSRATPQMRELAARLLAQESAAAKAPEARRPPVFQVCEKLRPPLATLMGKAGFRAVLARALVLAGGEAPRLRAWQVDAAGVLEGWDPLEVDAGPESGALVVAQLLGLLAAFIGESLTLRQVREVLAGAFRSKICISPREIIHEKIQRRGPA